MSFASFSHVECSLLARQIAQILQGRNFEDSAVAAPTIAAMLGRGEREVRRCIAKEYLQIQQMAGGLLCSKPGAGFWLCMDADEIRARYRLLKGLAGTAQRKLEDFVAAVRAFKLTGLLRTEGHTQP